MNSLAFFEHMYVCGGGLVAKLSPTVCNPMGCSLQGSSVHGISQVKVLKWVAIYIHFFEHIYWVGQKVHLDFSVRCYRKIIYMCVCVCIVCIYAYRVCVYIHMCTHSCIHILGGPKSSFKFFSNILWKNP